MTTRNEIIKAARRCLGTPYHHQGRRLGIGLDCIGLICHICEQIRLDVWDMKVYSREPDGKLAEYIRRNGGVQIPYERKQPGDILLFWISRSSRLPQHVGILSEPSKFIHSYVSAGKVVEHSFAGAWPRMVTHVFQFPGVQ